MLITLKLGLIQVRTFLVIIIPLVSQKAKIGSERVEFVLDSFKGLVETAMG
jgi:hypothetical protein